MAESSTTGVDPRYDPRFQRGYTGGAETDAAGSRSRPPQAAPLAQQQQQQPKREPREELERRAFEHTARTMPPEYERFAPVGSVAASRAAHAEASARSIAGADSNADGDTGSDANADRNSASVAWFDESDAASTGSADPWFLGAWVLSVLAVALGAGLFLTAVMSQNFYGPSTSTDMWLQFAGWTVAPALVQGGLLGIVTMLVWTGVRHARAEAQRAVDAA